MTKVNFAEAREKAEKAGLLGKGDYYKPAEGDNRIRLMSECLEHPGEFNGKPTFKWLCYVLDRKTARILPYFMPHTVYKQIEVLQLDADYAFDEVPMPYDITINAKGAGTKEVEYTVLPRPKAPLTAEEQKALGEVKPIRELQRLLQEEATASQSQVQAPGPTDNDVPPEFV